MRKNITFKTTLDREIVSRKNIKFQYKKGF